MLAWPARSPERVLHYPFTPVGLRFMQMWFFVHHIGLLILLLALALSGAAGQGRLARTKAANEGVMGAGYGLTTSLVGLGMLAAGAGVIRARRWLGWWRYVPVLIGAAHFVVVTLAIFSNGYVIARLAIAFWMALFMPEKRAVIAHEGAPLVNIALQ